MIGTLGDFVFEVHDGTLRTFSGMTYTVGAKYQTHSRIGQRPLLEYTGMDVESLTMTIRLSAFMGIDPRAEAKKYNDACRDGVAMRFFLGKRRFGPDYWVISKVVNQYNNIDNRGRIIDSTLKLTLSAYNDR